MQIAGNRPPLNLLRATAVFEEQKKGHALSPDAILLLKWMRRAKARAARLAHYRSRNAAYQYQSNRQQQRFAKGKQWRGMQEAV